MFFILLIHISNFVSIRYYLLYDLWGGQNLSLGVRLGFHSLITLRPRRRKHGKGPVTNNRAGEHPGMLVREGHHPRI